MADEKPLGRLFTFINPNWVDATQVVAYRVNDATPEKRSATYWVAGCPEPFHATGDAFLVLFHAIDVPVPEAGLPKPRGGAGGGRVNY